MKTYNAITKFQLKHKLKLSGALDEDTQEVLKQESLNLLKKISQMKSYPNSYIFINTPKEWYSNDWIFVFRSNSSLIRQQMAFMASYDFSNVPFICYLFGNIPEHILKHKNKDSAKNLNNFIVLDKYNYINKPDYLSKGDILFSTKDIAIVLESGMQANKIAPVEVIAKPQKVRIKSEKRVNIRSKPSLESSIITQMLPGTSFTIIEEREGWGKLKSGRGWVNLNFVEKL